MTRWLPLAFLLAACGTAEKQAPETPALPAWPRERDLLEFYVAASSEFRFFVDPASITLTPDGVVHYTLVARSSTGAQNVSFEGMRCNSGEVRMHALGVPERDGGGAWTGKPGPWRPIEPRSVQRWHNALYREYFCPQREPIASAREGIEALRRGGPSITRSISEDMPRGGGAR